MEPSRSLLHRLKSLLSRRSKAERRGAERSTREAEDEGAAGGAAAAGPLEVRVIYAYIETELEKEFPGKLEIRIDRAPRFTRWFEVLVGGKLVHSKENGDGFVNKPEKLQKVITAVREALA